MQQTILKITLAVTTLIFSSFSNAALVGPYGGIGLGLAKLQLPSGNFFNAGSIGGQDTRTIGELDGKLLLGYTFTRFAGIEASFSDYARSMYQGRAANGLNAQLRYIVSALNITGKAYLPLGRKTPFKIDCYLLGGLAETFSNVNYQNNGIPIANNADASVFPMGGTDTSKLRPIFGGGILYHITNTRILIEIEYTRIAGIGNIKTDARAIPNADMFTANILYSFSKIIQDASTLT